ncbi:DUF932 domain-containing protein [Nocardia brasiliensis]|uniref:DUF932 domain-containing protein n=1 Tax=Nocardia brasiliensis TaxID=37326 RepID=A0A6G9XY95_NOCBR|nr:DUF932 domain-containing protein [Nocardia brasiliensis]QIS05909.1 DUF932 domain-containing protein [Nocardia brasiliensis]
MSKETIEWLNTYTLIGMTEKRGTAWHYRKSVQGDQPNHYKGFVPVADVVSRLFNWEAQSAPIRYDIHGTVENFTNIDDNGAMFRTITNDSRKVIYRSDTGALLGVFKQGYRIHQFQEWLLDNLASLITPDGLAVTTDSLGIGSAGLLKGGAQAWVQLERPENVKTKEGVEFRSSVLASSSHDGTVATQFSAVQTIVVCDNTHCGAMGEARASGKRFKFKRTKNSLDKIGDARQALGIVVESADDFAATVADLCATTVTDRQFSEFLTLWAPVPEEKGRGRTMAENRRDALTTMYNTDMRAAPWRGTAFGVLQSVNTYNHHGSTVRGETSRAERNMSNAITGKTGEADAEALGMLNRVLMSA